MAIGPVEMLVVKFPGNQFTGEIVPALKELVESGTVRILDILFIKKDAAMNIEMTEIRDLISGDPVLDRAAASLTAVVSEEDVEEFGAMLEPNSSAAVILFENTWATRFADAVYKAKGEVIINQRIPRSVINELVAEAA
jgi:hypothetical protein